MRLHLVSDVHGNDRALAGAGRGADGLLLLGDLLEALDYDDPSAGIMGELHGAKQVQRWIDLRTHGTPEAARAQIVSMLDALSQRTGRPAAQVQCEAIAGMYQRMFAALPTPVWATYGNVDMPALWPRFQRPGIEILDGDCVELGGLRFGFIGGGLARFDNDYPYFRTEADIARRVRQLGPVDVLCSHLPPAVPDLAYDVVARKVEPSSVSLLQAVQQLRPRWHFFGHVHNPLAHRVRIDRTECINIGHFRATETPYVLEF